jgi:DNA-binding NarL/FixJ family response regulator
LKRRRLYEEGGVLNHPHDFLDRSDVCCTLLPVLQEIHPESHPPCITLPRMNRIEFIRVTEHYEDLKRIPVVMLAASNEERDKVESFRLGVAGYMVKPVDYQQFVEVVRTIDLYWTLSKLPQGE